MRLLKIGHDPSCDIVLYSNKVSKVHAELTMLDNGDILIEDKGSLNGTYVMNQPLMPGKQVNVRRGDRILFADTELQWSQVPAPEDNSSYKAVVGIGTNANNDIQISGATVSRYHATVKVGRDGKVYLIDHSKNGTMVNGVRIPSNQAVQIKKSDSVVCGGVPVNLATNHNIQWPSVAWKKIAAVVAAIAVIGIIVAIFNNTPKPNGEIASLVDTSIIVPDGHLTDNEIYDKNKNAVVFLTGLYYYHAFVEDTNLEGDFKGVDINGNLESVEQGGYNSYEATGFFISKDGMIATNLHVAKPWLVKNGPSVKRDIEREFKKLLIAIGHSEFTEYVQVEGRLKYIAAIPYGMYFDGDNFIKCKAIEEVNWDDMEKDVALIETMNKKLPEGCTYIDESNWLLDANLINVGDHMVTIGFPAGSTLQNFQDKGGAQCIMQNGQINKAHTEYQINYNADTHGGASGSPVFNDKGQLIAVHHAGANALGITGNNFGIKLRYLKQLVDKERDR